MQFDINPNGILIDNLGVVTQSHNSVHNHLVNRHTYKLESFKSKFQDTLAQLRYAVAQVHAGHSLQLLPHALAIGLPQYPMGRLVCPGGIAIVTCTSDLY